MSDPDRSGWRPISIVPVDGRFADCAPTDRTCCRLAGEPLGHVTVDLGMSPLFEDLLPAERLRRKEPFYPLTVFVCGRCYTRGSQIRLPVADQDAEHEA
jgi:hypothetical protein